MEELQRERRFLMMSLALSFIIQLIILAIYYFKEKQTVLAFPMILGLFLTGSTFGRVAMNRHLPK